VTKRYREPLEEIECEGERPVAFAWRGRRYRVTGVLGHWREDPGWWARPGGAAVRIEQADLWRVEADARAPAADGAGVYELVCRGGAWRLDRVWD
jgi:hypothetical protein